MRNFDERDDWERAPRAAPDVDQAEPPRSPEDVRWSRRLWGLGALSGGAIAYGLWDHPTVGGTVHVLVWGSVVLGAYTLKYVDLWDA